jgi:hypothetical protein
VPGDGGELVDMLPDAILEHNPVSLTWDLLPPLQMRVLLLLL